MCVEVGEVVKWMLPLDHEYSYGVVLSVDRCVVRVVHTGGYYNGMEVDVHIRYIEKGGNDGGNKAKRRR